MRAKNNKVTVDFWFVTSILAIDLFNHLNSGERPMNQIISIIYDGAFFESQQKLINCFALVKSTNLFHMFILAVTAILRGS